MADAKSDVLDAAGGRAGLAAVDGATAGRAELPADR